VEKFWKSCKHILTLVYLLASCNLAYSEAQMIFCKLFDFVMKLKLSTHKMTRGGVHTINIFRERNHIATIY